MIKSISPAAFSRFLREVGFAEKACSCTLENAKEVFESKKEVILDPKLDETLMIEFRPSVSPPGWKGRIEKYWSISIFAEDRNGEYKDIWGSISYVPNDFLESFLKTFHCRIDSSVERPCESMVINLKYSANK